MLYSAQLYSHPSHRTKFKCILLEPARYTEVKSYQCPATSHPIYNKMKEFMEKNVTPLCVHMADAAGGATDTVSLPSHHLGPLWEESLWQ